MIHLIITITDEVGPVEGNLKILKHINRTQPVYDTEELIAEGCLKAVTKALDDLTERLRELPNLTITKLDIDHGPTDNTDNPKDRR
jgi:hypothetical protein